MNQSLRAGRMAIVSLLMVIAAVALCAAPAHAASFQLVKTFDTALVGTASFNFTIETKIFGVWIEIPCVDGVGSCTTEFSNLTAGTSVVLADSDRPWFQNGDFYIKEVAPAGWTLDSVTSAGTSLLQFNRPSGEAYFSFSDLADGNVTLHNVGPDVGTEVPEPGSLTLLALGLAGSARAMRRKLTSAKSGKARTSRA